MPATVADELTTATGTEVVILNVERGSSPPVSSEATNTTTELKTDSATTLGGAAAAVTALEGATVRHRIWVGNLLTVEIDLDEHDISELAEIEGVTHVAPNVAFERTPHPSQNTSGVAGPQGGLTASSPFDAASHRSSNTSDTAENGSGSSTVTVGLEQLDAPGFEEEFDGERGGNATIAIVDNGFSDETLENPEGDSESSHPDFDIDQRFTILEGEVTEGEITGGSGHGEHVAGTAVGTADPVGDVPRYGVAPDAELIKIDVFGTTPGASFEDVALGLETAVEEGADVAGFSLGADPPEEDQPGVAFNSAIADTIDEATAAGTVVSISSGNAAEGTVGSPGSDFNALSVGATTEAGDIAGFSSGALVNDRTIVEGFLSGDELPETVPSQYVKPDVSAAGVDVLSAGPLGVPEGDPEASYSVANGTSMAQPHVAGAVALLQSVSEEELSPAQIESLLVETAERPPDENLPRVHNRDVRYGTGIINVTAAALAIDELETATGTVTVDDDPLPGAAVTSVDGAIGATNKDGEGTVHTTTENVTVSAFGFTTAAAAINDTNTDGTDLGEIELTESVDVFVVDEQPASVDPGEQFDIEVETANLEELTVNLTDDSDVAAEAVTVELDGDEVPLDEATDVPGAPVTGTATLTVETDEGVGGDLGIKHTFAGAGEEVTIETGPTTVERPFFAVSNLNTPESVAPGETIAVDATIINTGAQEDTQDVEFVADGAVLDNETLTLAPGQRGAVEFNHTIATETDGELLEVTTEDDADTVVVPAPANSTLSNLTISDQGRTATVPDGDDVDIEVNVTNIGGVAGDFGADLTIENESVQVDQTQSVDALGAGETETVTFDSVTDELAVDNYSVTVETDDDEVSGSLTVEEADSLLAAFTARDQTVTQAENEPLTLAITDAVDQAGDDFAENGTDVSVTAQDLDGADQAGDGIDEPLNVTVDFDAGNGSVELLNASAVADLETQEDTELTATVSGDNATDGKTTATFTVTIVRPVYFEITDVRPHDAEVTAGEALDIAADITNTGVKNGTQTVVLNVDTTQDGTIDEHHVDATEVANLSPSGSDTVTLTYNTDVGVAPAVDVVAATDDDAGIATATIEAADDNGNGDGGTDSGGGGGGGGPPPTTPPATDVPPAQDLIVVEDTVALDVGAGQSTASFADTAPVTTVTFTTPVSGTVTTRQLEEPPDGVASPPGRAVAITQLTVPRVAESISAELGLRVGTAQLAAEEVPAADLRPLQYTDGTWEPLPAGDTSVTDDGVVIETTTPSFSVFAVTAVSEPDAVLDVPTTVTAGETVTLDASGSTTTYGEVVGFEWTVDGEQVTGETATVTLDDPGPVTVTLTVETDAGETSTATQTVTVTEDAPGTTDDAADADDAEGEGEEETDAVPGFGVLAAVVALLLWAGYTAARRW